MRSRLAVETDEFLDAAVRHHRAQRQTMKNGAGTGILAAGGLDFPHARDHPFAVSRAGEMGGGII
ncbi:MAG: hypothetical protein NTV46_17130 [Verrucomicrobia bacterium]|nr:hypothetical protein [Verrucomicrobiota bacterium]